MSGAAEKLMQFLPGAIETGAGVATGNPALAVGGATQLAQAGAGAGGHPTNSGGIAGASSLGMPNSLASLGSMVNANPLSGLDPAGALGTGQQMVGGQPQQQQGQKPGDPPDTNQNAQWAGTGEVGALYMQYMQDRHLMKMKNRQIQAPDPHTSGGPGVTGLQLPPPLTATQLPQI